VASLQDKIPEGTLLIEYFAGKEALYIFLITKNRYSLRKYDAIHQLNEHISIFKSALISEQSDEDSIYTSFNTSAFEIYKATLGQELRTFADNESINRISIIPDGSLSYIPFELLTSSPVNGKRTNYRVLPYLAKRYAISYGQSASLLFKENSMENFSDSENRLIAFAPTYDNKLASFRQEKTLSKLKWNQPEVESINKQFDGVSFKGTNATESNFKQMVKKYEIVHLAMHGFVDKNNPTNSGLIFSRMSSQDTLAEDGYLYAHELYNMDINSKLAVLSACNTGYGKFTKGEGVMSLAHAFSYAGCPSIVMSHWNVDDESTAKLM